MSVQVSTEQAQETADDESLKALGQDLGRSIPAGGDVMRSLESEFPDDFAGR